MSRQFGIVAVRTNLSFKDVIDSLNQNDYVDIMFTFHPDIDRYLPSLVRQITANGVNCRLLVGDPESPSVERRFNYISEDAGGFIWAGNDMIDRLRLFLNKTVPNVLGMNRQFVSGKLFQIRLFKHLPDIPLIIIRAGLPDGPSRIRYVLQGYYLRRPAIELPFIEWAGEGKTYNEEGNMARMLSSYFDARWTNGTDISIVVRDSGDISLKGGVDDDSISEDR